MHVARWMLSARHAPFLRAYPSMACCMLCASCTTVYVARTATPEYTHLNHDRQLRLAPHALVMVLHVVQPREHEILLRSEPHQYALRAVVHRVPHRVSHRPPCALWLPHRPRPVGLTLSARACVPLRVRASTVIQPPALMMRSFSSGRFGFCTVRAVTMPRCHTALQARPASEVATLYIGTSMQCSAAHCSAVQCGAVRCSAVQCSFRQRRHSAQWQVQPLMPWRTAIAGGPTDLRHRDRVRDPLAAQHRLRCMPTTAADRIARVIIASDVCARCVDSAWILRAPAQM